jgi:hypothetical protein
MVDLPRLNSNLFTSFYIVYKIIFLYYIFLMNNLLNDYGILFLVILFIAISLYYKNFVNIGIFLVFFFALRNIVSNEQALLYSYCLAIFYGIVKNFHLLENFTANKNQSNNSNTSSETKLIPGKKKRITAISDLFKDSDKLETQKKTQTPTPTQLSTKKNKKKVKKLNKQHCEQVNLKTEPPEIGEFITEDFINKFIKRLKKEDNLLILKEKQNIYNLNPTINKLSKNKVEKIKDKLTKDTQLVKKPIVISNDNFILDGHHRWYAKKGIIESNTNGYNTTDLYDENVNVVIIDYNIRKCVQKLQEYKIKYNKEYLNKSLDGIENISNGKQYLDEIKETVKHLESNYNKFASVKLV